MKDTNKIGRSIDREKGLRWTENVGRGGSDPSVEHLRLDSQFNSHVDGRREKC